MVPACLIAVSATLEVLEKAVIRVGIASIVHSEMDPLRAIEVIWEKAVIMRKTAAILH
jgi:hypothetical protein